LNASEGVVVVREAVVHVRAVVEALGEADRYVVHVTRNIPLQKTSTLKLTLVFSYAFRCGESASGLSNHLFLYLVVAFLKYHSKTSSTNFSAQF
jgi:hypothetical protein